MGECFEISILIKNEYYSDSERYDKILSDFLGLPLGNILHLESKWRILSGRNVIFNKYKFDECNYFEYEISIEHLDFTQTLIDELFIFFNELFLLVPIGLYIVASFESNSTFLGTGGKIEDLEKSFGKFPFIGYAKNMVLKGNYGIIKEMTNCSIIRNEQGQLINNMNGTEVK